MHKACVEKAPLYVPHSFKSGFPFSAGKLTTWHFRGNGAAIPTIQRYLAYNNPPP